MKLRRLCPTTWEVFELDDDAACPGLSIATDAAASPRIVTCGIAGHTPLADQTLCGQWLGFDEPCTQPAHHKGHCVSDLDVASTMMED